MTRVELNEYWEKHGTEAAINLLLIGGPDAFEGDYDKTMQELEEVFLGSMEISFEISEAGIPLERVIEIVEAKYPGWRFSRTESRYESCIMAVFENN